MAACLWRGATTNDIRGGRPMNQREPVPATYPAGGTLGHSAADAEERKKMGRRALIAAAGLGVVGIAVAEKDQILNGVGNLTQQEIQNAINAGRRELAKELANVEGIGIDVAENVADITHNAVNLFVLPIASLLAGLTEITLDVASGAVEKAQQFTQLLHIDVQALQTLDGILKQWKANVAVFPIAVKSLNDTDTTSAKTYLNALKAKLEREAAQ
jgi:hypothetical protein